MDYIQAILLGLIQGATEFLPVSSSGHLLLTQRLLNLDDKTFGLTFDVALHLGTLLALLFFFRRELLAFPGTLLARRRSPVAVEPVLASEMYGAGFQGMEQPVPDADPSTPQYDLITPRLAGLVIIGCIPAVVAGALLGDFIEQSVREPLLVAAMLALFGIVMLVADRRGVKKGYVNQLGWQAALLIGCAQAVALVPGVSRAGITITAALFLGMRREEAARFSFLMAMPIIAGAGAKESLKFFKEPITAQHASLFVVGIVVAAITGFFALRFLIRFLTTFSLAAFTYYRLGLALLVVIIFTLFR